MVLHQQLIIIIIGIIIIISSSVVYVKYSQMSTGPSSVLLCNLKATFSFGRFSLSH